MGCSDFAIDAAGNVGVKLHQSTGCPDATMQLSDVAKYLSLTLLNEQKLSTLLCINSNAGEMCLDQAVKQMAREQYIVHLEWKDLVFYC